MPEILPPEYGLWTSALNWVWDVNTLAFVRMRQPLITTDTLSVNADVTDRAARVLGVITAPSLLAELQLKADLTETQPVSAASLPLPTNAAQESGGNLSVLAGKDFATSALQGTGNTSLGSIDTKLTSQATAANQVTLQTAVDAINTKTPALGQAAMAASQPVVIASNQSAVPVAGAKTHNAAVPGATNLGTLPALATAAAPTYTEGNQVGLSTDLAGNVRITGAISATSAATATAADPSYTEGAAANLSQDLGGRQRMLGYAHVSDVPETYVPADVKPLSMTTDGRVRVAVADARVMDAPFSDEMRGSWGELRPWENGSKPYFDGSAWASW